MSFAFHMDIFAFLESWSWINGRALSDYIYYTEDDLCENRLPSEPRHRSCGILNRARRGRLCMNVDVCDRKLNFICEKGMFHLVISIRITIVFFPQWSIGAVR